MSESSGTESLQFWYSPLVQDSRLVLGYEKPSLFSSSSRDRNLGPSESACRHYAYPNRVPLLLAAPLVNHERNWKCLDIQAQGFPVALKDYVHRPISHLNSCNQSSNSCNSSLCTSSCPSFFLSFSVSVGFSVVLHSYFHFFRVLDFRCIC